MGDCYEEGQRLGSRMTNERFFASANSSASSLSTTAFGRPISNELLIICRFECAKSWPFRIFSLSGRTDRPNIPAIRHRNTNLCL
jgi:hypothetical protein